MTVLITGASSGIGLELARICANAKHRLILTARSTPALEQLAEQCRRDEGIDVQVIPTDLADAGGATYLFDEIQRRALTVDVLINNAGFGTHGPFWENDLAGELALVQVNVLSLLALTRLILPGMVARGRGKIMNVASTAAFFPGPLMANYYASKAYVLSFSQALSNELRHKGVTVTALCPGPTATNFQQRAGMRHSRLFDVAGLSAQAVARAGYQAMMRGRRVCIPGAGNRLLAALSHFVPRGLALKVLRKLNQSR